jgi:hypothetical protein
MNLLRNLLTEPDGVTFCPVRMCLAAAGTFYHAGAAWMVFGQHTPIDMALLGLYVQHMSTLAATCAASVGAKSILKADAPSQPS